MRILQLIDSLEPGGAERVAITYANVLCKHTQGSFLCATRAEGALKHSVSKEVGYLFLERSKRIDIRALKSLLHFIQEHDIDIIHAHGTSFFIATQVKIMVPKIKIVWHDHLGSRAFQPISKHRTLEVLSRFFSTIFTVNTALKTWSENYLKTPIVLLLPNFISAEQVVLSRAIQEKQIICLANLKTPKNHLNLLRACSPVFKKHPDWSLVLVGRDHDDTYSKSMRDYIVANMLDNNVVLLGSRSDIPYLLSKAAIGVLSSDSEGLPMALLEYGGAGLAVIATKVGQSEEVVGSNGILVPPKAPGVLADAILHYIENKTLRTRDALQFQLHIKEKYTANAVLETVLQAYKKMIVS